MAQFRMSGSANRLKPSQWEGAPARQLPRSPRPPAIPFRCLGLLIPVLGPAAIQAETRESEHDRVLRKQVTVAATPAEIWRLWTTQAGLAEFLTPDSKLELRVGGPYEIYFSMEAPAGQRGSEGCRVLAFVPNEMLAFEWNFPPSIPELRNAAAHTFVVLRIDAVDAVHSRVRLEQRGWQTGEAWERGFAYFDKAWGDVLGQLQASLAAKAASQPAAAAGTRTVRNEYIVNAPLAQTWRLFTTGEGWLFWAVRRVEDDFRVGGAIRATYHPSEPIGGPNTITHHILAYEPERFFATRVETPADTPVTKAIEAGWNIYYFDAIDADHTRVTLVNCGWGDAPEFRAAERFFADRNPTLFEGLNQKLRDVGFPPRAVASEPSQR